MLWLSTPPSGDEIDPTIVTPGVWGFIITFAVVIAVVLLVVDMVRRTRRVTYRAAVNDKLDAEERAARDPD